MCPTVSGLLQWLRRPQDPLMARLLVGAQSHFNRSETHREINYC